MINNTTTKILKTFYHCFLSCKSKKANTLWPKVSKTRGNILTLTVLIFTMTTLTLSLGIISPIMKHIKNVRGAVYSKQAFYTAESLQEDILYRLKKDILVSDAESLVLNNSASDAVISGVDKKTITVSSNVSGYERKIVINIVPLKDELFGSSTKNDFWKIDSWQESTQ